MIFDVTGIELIPGEMGENCPGNGLHYNENGEMIPCLCDECDYMMCCLPTYHMEDCGSCSCTECPHSGSPTKTIP